MAMKHKGIGAERELLHMFCTTGKWLAMRAPASGSIKYPCPDLIVGNRLRKLAIECKATKNRKQYISNEQIESLKEFARIFGCEPWIGVRFNKTLDNNAWYFMSLEDMERTAAENYVITLENAKRKGLLFEELVDFQKLS